MIKQPALFFCIFSFLFYFQTQVFAAKQYVTLFDDNFTSLDSNVWGNYNSGGQIAINNGLVLSSTNNTHFPLIYLKNNHIPVDGDYFIRVVYEFPPVSDFGVGIGIGNEVPEYDISPTQFVSKDKEYLYFLIWGGANDGHLIQSRHCITNIDCELNRTNLLVSPINTNSHIVEISYIDNDFILYSDGVQLLNPILIGSGRRPTVVWFGNPMTLNSPQNWSSIRIKKLEIGKITETVNPKTPVIILPGFGASC